MPKVIIDGFDPNDPDAFPKQVDIPYSELDDETLVELAMSGDAGAVEYMNEVAKDRLTTHPGDFEFED